MGTLADWFTVALLMEGCFSHFSAHMCIQTKFLKVLTCWFIIANGTGGEKRIPM